MARHELSSSVGTKKHPLLTALPLSDVKLQKVVFAMGGAISSFPTLTERIGHQPNGWQAGGNRVCVYLGR